MLDDKVRKQEKFKITCGSHLFIVLIKKINYGGIHWISVD